MMFSCSLILGRTQQERKRRENFFLASLYYEKNVQVKIYEMMSGTRSTIQGKRGGGRQLMGKGRKMRTLCKKVGVSCIILPPSHIKCPL